MFPRTANIMVVVVSQNKILDLVVVAVVEFVESQAVMIHIGILRQDISVVVAAAFTLRYGLPRIDEWFHQTQATESEPNLACFWRWWVPFA